ncbi:MAG: hypothetical protein WAR79_02300 [Melioribacteraceae bacterium]
MFTHRGVFSNYENTPKKDEILQSEKSRLKVDHLTLEQERTVLSKVGKYRSNAYVIRDYGDYVIAFSAKMYIENLMNTEQELKEEAMYEKYSTEKIQAALKKINTYKLAHKLSIIILGAVYQQGKHEELAISKQTLLNLLGYTTADKYIYSDINEAIHSLRWLDYRIYNYNTKLKLRQESTSTGNFIYNLTENKTEYIFWVNPLFVGCAVHMATDGANLSTEEKKSQFQRGYLNYPLNHLAESRDRSDAAYYLGHYLLTQNGNAKLNNKEYKVITIKYEKLLEESRIEHTRANVKVNKLLNALEEITFIDKIEPSIEELKRRKSSQVELETLHIYINQQKPSNPKGAKIG